MAVKKKRITNEMIERHLKKQDIELQIHLWFALLVFPASIIIAGIILLTPIGDPGILVYGIVLFIAYLIMYSRASKKLKR